MKPRHVAQRRESREVVGESVGHARELQLRLTGRTEADRPWESEDTRRALVWDHRPVPIAEQYTVEPAPNAPLLKRVIRYPISMTPEPPKRIQLFDGSRENTRRSPLPSVPMTFRDASATRAASGPMSALDFRPEHRQHPFRRARRRNEEEGP